MATFKRRSVVASPTFLRRVKPGENIMNIILTGFWDDSQVWEDDRYWSDGGSNPSIWKRRPAI